jgi:hypothetical protein
MLGLGKRLTDPNGKVIGFSVRDHFTFEDPEHTRALLTFLADTAGETVVVKFDHDAEFEEIATYSEIGGDAYNDIPFDEYLRGEPTSS